MGIMSSWLLFSDYCNHSINYLEAPSLHGNSVQNEVKSPTLKVCDYSTGAIMEHATLKLQVEKSKLDSKNLNFSVENGTIKMER